MRIYADAHVHFYRCFDLRRLLSAAQRRAAGLDGPLLLLLCESAGYRYFEALRAVAEGRRAELPPNVGPELLAAFPPAPTDEPDSLRLGDLVVVAGRQLVSLETIEVLALAADPEEAMSDVRDREHTARDLLFQALETGALAVLPWGVGKWLGERGRRVGKLCADPDFATHPRFFTGDVAQRCWPWPEPSAFADTRVLAGSDILPVAGAEDRLAGYGFRLDAAWDPEQPARSLRRALEEGAEPETWGRREGLASTLAEQLRYRARGGDR